jgi:hypothetical protein
MLGMGTPVHDWCSTPTRDLIWYVLGITPAEPGYRRVRVAPRLGRLQEAAGAVPTPHGYAEVRIAGSEEVHSPVPIMSFTRMAPKPSSQRVNIGARSANEMLGLHRCGLTGYVQYVSVPA